MSCLSEAARKAPTGRAARHTQWGHGGRYIEEALAFYGSHNIGEMERFFAELDGLLEAEIKARVWSVCFNPVVLAQTQSPLSIPAWRDIQLLRLVLDQPACDHCKNTRSHGCS